MITTVDGIEIVYDKETDFMMLRSCYLNGGNCYNCLEGTIEGCPIDEIDIEELPDE